ncbi:uncharacterized protein EI90DRAFT_2907200 [Cantharellus anzutake]|uniref:uncharacterized protein n=1 Tax=Cantharellus anzutake TaxID=1750568 RepID=UPI00190558F2|nr:uncharacterized protein EI90DRAFT_2907200 [Cantharellus anzutake]KAF8339576.1 hypothetical protein EI90DRAFT_2907200 [Cantharellus anzutake]
MTESGSSFAIFPNFHFNLHDITPLGKLCGERPAARAEWPTQKFSVLVAVIEVFGLDIVKVKKGAASGTEVAVISFVIGDHTGAIVKLTAWRETAEHFDGSDEDNPQIKKGDVVCFKDVVLAPGPSVSLNASPNHQSTHEICYRSLPIVPADRRFTPDLKLGRSDAVVRHVAQIVEWVIMMAGLPLP